MRKAPSGVPCVLTVLVLICGCAAPLPSPRPSDLPTQTAEQPDPLPPFALPRAFLEVAPRTTLPIYATEDATDAFTKLEEGGLLQLLEVGDRGRVEVQVYDPIDGTAFGWTDIGTMAHPLAIPPAQPGVCPATADVNMLSGLWEPERLACFGDRQLVMPAVLLVRGPVPGRQYAGEPTWLAEVSGVAARSGFADGEVMSGVHLPPEILLPDPDEWVRMVGHFDDPRSSECRRASLRQFIPDQTQSDAVLWCRQQFVVTALFPTLPPAPVTTPPDVEGP